MKMRFLALPLLATAGLLTPFTVAQAPVSDIMQQGSAVEFNVKASVAIAGKFDKWDSTLKFASPDATTGVLDLKVQSASVDTGSGMKDGKSEEQRLLRRSE